MLDIACVSLADPRFDKARRRNGFMCMLLPMIETCWLFADIFVQIAYFFVQMPKYLKFA